MQAFAYRWMSHVTLSLSTVAPAKSVASPPDPGGRGLDSDRVRTG